MNYKKCFGTASAALMIVIIVTLVLAPGAWAASKYKTLYKFKGGADGSSPYSALIFDGAGNLYGTTNEGGAYGWGTVFELRHNSNGGWKEQVLYSFTGGADGGGPLASLIFDSAGSLYGTTAGGGTRNISCGSSGCGVVFKLTTNASGNWTENVIYSFTGESDGYLPTAGLIFDSTGSLYSTTYGNNEYTGGTVFRLTPNSDGSWTESVISGFTSGGCLPWGGLIFDPGGNLYGTTVWCGEYNYGVVFELTPDSDGSWTEHLLYQFKGNNGGNPEASMIFDSAGNLYGTGSGGGSTDCAGGCGGTFSLTPTSAGRWKYRRLHNFTSAPGTGPLGPVGGLIFDALGNLYGTAPVGGYGYGVVFKQSPTSAGGWEYAVLYRFSDAPGAYPYAGLVLDPAGNLYGTTLGDRSKTFGSVFEITP